MTEAGIGALRGRVVSPRRWLRAVAVIGATAMLLASSCTWQLSLFITDGVPPPPGDPVPPVDTHRRRPARGSVARMGGETCCGIGNSGHRAGGLRLRRSRRRGRESQVSSCVDHAGGHRAGGESPRNLPGRHDCAQWGCKPPIRGVRLDGTGGTLRIVDRDGGGLDGDAAVERAMGPMQFISETWRLYGVAARNDGIANVDNIDDAALSAAGYLCWRGKDLATPRGWITALRAYNNSVIYARAVRDWATAYAAGHPL